ncbi:MAG: sugar phosphate isomerase/epimerase family protein [Pirellulales bacterium]
MLTGIVSNCWRLQLEGGAKLEELVAEAARQGFQAIELRQGCLGEFEDRESQIPRPAALAELARRFPELRFNLALAWPFFDSEWPLDDPLLSAGLAAAQALAPLPGATHLRLVDVSTDDGAAARDNLELLASRIASIARQLFDGGGKLSLENGRQPWTRMVHLMALTREHAQATGAEICLCYDPANVPDIAQPAVARQVLADVSRLSLGMVHFKQLRAGEMQAEVNAGDIDWKVQIQTLSRLGYAGPACLEIRASQEIWRHLLASRKYIDALEKAGD